MTFTMNKAKFQETGGFPMETDTLDFMQSAYTIFNALADVTGHLTILKGCIVTGSSVSDGVVAINGEVLAFKGGGLGPNVLIKEDKKKKNFEDGSAKDVYLDRYVTFGTSPSSFPWSSFKRMDSLLTIMSSINSHTNNISNPHKVMASQIGLGNVNNTSDSKKPVSIAQQNAINLHATNTNNPHKVTAEQIGILHRDSVHIGDIAGKKVGKFNDKVYVIESVPSSIENGGDELLRISFRKTLSSSNYLVLGSLRETNSRRWNDSNENSFIILEKMPTNFQLAIRELHGSLQDFYFEYIVIAL